MKNLELENNPRKFESLFLKFRILVIYNLYLKF